MRWIAIVAAIMLAACNAKPEAEAQTNSTAKQCYSVDQCKAFIERQTTKAELFKAVDALIESPEAIKKDVMRQFYETNRAKYTSIIERNPFLDYYSKEEIGEYYAKLKEQRNKPMKVLTHYRGGGTVIRMSDVTSISCDGLIQQGGAVLCQTAPNAKVKVARSEKDFYFENADGNGRIIIGFDRDETNNFVEVLGDRVTFDLPKREYSISRIDGLPPSQVSTFTDVQLKHIKASSARKKVGFASRATDMGFRDGFTYPLKEFKKTSPFGAQRILNGEAKRPHYGVDIAAPIGTPIYAPADGIVSLADEDLYFEGAMVLLDHGQGLISMYLHTDSILVEPGQQVRRGDQIATVGSKGRSTGPHLCWRLKWRNRNLDPELLTEWPDADRPE